LLDYDRSGAPWRLRWGLYTGEAIVHQARDLYFRRFGEMLLRGLNDSITAKLRSSPSTARTDDPNYGLISDQLKTHLMISSGVCKPDQAFVSRLLRQTLDETNPSGGYEWRQRADRQIDFYAAELPSGNPVKRAQDPAAVDNARRYLRSVQGADRIYAGLLNNAEKRFATSQTIAMLAPNYAKVLNGSPEVSGVFTPEGWSFIKNASKDVKANMPGDSCLDESRGSITAYQQDAALESKIRRLFVRDYIARWQKFVGSFSVVRYSGPGDAARKLEILSDHKSPLLAVFALASRNTYFPPAQPSTIEKSIAPITSVFDKAKETFGAGKKDLPRADAKQIESTADIFNSFQPVQYVVSGQSDTWVSDKNNAYIDALAQLGSSMDAIAQATNPDPALIQTANLNKDKAVAAAFQLEKWLSPNSNGLDAIVQRLLDEPITQAKSLIPRTVDITLQINGAAQHFCAGNSSIFRKFPFQPSTEDVSLDEFSRLFAPGSGSVWKFQADNLADSVIKDGTQWKAKDGAKLQISAGMLNFLKSAQAVTDAFFPNGASQPQLRYTLRPKLDPAYQNAFIELDVDGQSYQWKNSLQKQFTWPASPGGSGGGAVGRVVTGGVSIPFASRGGPWAVFRLMRDAEPRLLGSKIVEWKNLRGGDGRLESMSVPVRLEFVEFPGGADVFNPKFFDGLQCTAKAVQQLQP
jgi:type VI secretion system protein ImpL